MLVILLKDVKNVGKKDQTINVSDGYAMNYLLPRHLAVQATAKSREILNDQQTARKEEFEKNKQNATVLAELLKNKEITLKAKIGKDGKMFGSVSLKQIEDELLKQHNIAIDKRKFVDKGPLDTLGFYHLKIELFKGVIGVINVHIVEEDK